LVKDILKRFDGDIVARELASHRDWLAKLNGSPKEAQP